MQEQAPVTPDYDLGHYLRPVRRHRKLLVATVLFGLILGVAYVFVSGRTYTSSEAINVYPPPVVPGQPTAVNPQGARTNGLVNLDTESQIAKSTAVVAAAQKALHSTASISALKSRISVTVPPNSTILRISCKARSASAAQQCASAVTTAYLNNRTATENAAIQRQLKATNAAIKKIELALIADATAIQNSTAGSVARNHAFADQQSDTSARQSMLSDRTQLTTEDTTPGVILSAATPGSTSKLTRGIPPLTGLIVGLILGFGLIGWRERHDPLVRHSDDLRRGGVGLIAEIQQPSGRDTAKRRRTERVARTRFEQRVASVVAGSFDEGQGGVVYVAAVSPDQAPDNVAARLRATLASIGHDVEIVRPGEVEMASVPSIRPVSEPAADPASNADDDADDAHLSQLGWPGSTVDPPARETVAATPPLAVPEVAETTDSAPMSIRKRLEAAQRRAQFVIVDGEPAVTDAQAYVLAGLSDAALLVVDPETTRREDLDEVVDQISVTGSELLGAVIWRPERRKGWRGGKSEDAQAESGDEDMSTTDFGDLPSRGDRDDAEAVDSESWPQRPVDAAR